MLQLRVLTKRRASDESDEPYKTCLTKELLKDDLPQLTFQSCLENLLNQESIQQYKSAFSPDILLVKLKGDTVFKEVDDTEMLDRQMVTELGLVATKRRVLKEILKEVKKLEQKQSGPVKDKKERNAVIESFSSSSTSQSNSEESDKQEKTSTAVNLRKRNGDEVSLLREELNLMLKKHEELQNEFKAFKADCEQRLEQYKNRVPEAIFKTVIDTSMRETKPKVVVNVDNTEASTTCGTISACVTPTKGNARQRWKEKDSEIKTSDSIQMVPRDLSQFDKTIPGNRDDFI